MKRINKMCDKDMSGFRKSYGVDSDPGTVRKILTEQDNRFGKHIVINGQLVEFNIKQGKPGSIHYYEKKGQNHNSQDQPCTADSNKDNGQ